VIEIRQAETYANWFEACVIGKRERESMCVSADCRLAIRET